MVLQHWHVVGLTESVSGGIAPAGTREFETRKGQGSAGKVSGRGWEVDPHAGRLPVKVGDPLAVPRGLFASVGKNHLT
jgi:hypothetical protein